MKRLRVRLLGAGVITRAHIPGYLTCVDRAEIVAVADPKTGSVLASPARLVRT